jgi:hypothetical protein
VNEQCKIKFKIGSYQDEVLCDVISMDVYHVLLGRPWQFDKEQFMMGGKTLILLKRMVRDTCWYH